MTGSAAPSTPLSEKLSLVTHHHLLTRVPVKLDLDNWNYGSWQFFFEQLCHSYEVITFIHGPSTTPTSSTQNIPTPFTPEEQKVDKIVLSWIFTTLSDPLQARLVVARPRSAMEAWDLLSEIVKDNKRSRTNALKAELRALKLGDQTMEAYFQKIESIVTILASLESHVNDEDVVHYALEGLPEKYNQVCGYMHYKDTFPNLKTARSCRFGSNCRYVHDENAKSTTSNTPRQSSNTTDALLAKILDKLVLHESGPSRNNIPSTQNNTPVAYTATSIPTPYFVNQPAPYLAPPPGFSYPVAQTHVAQQQSTQPQQISQPASHQPAHVFPAAGTAHQAQPSIPPGFVTGPINNAGQPTMLPQAFTAGTLHDPTTGAWNMDTGASSHLNNSVTSLSTIFNSCIYPSVSVGDGHSIPVTNSGHSILPTPFKSLHLNNVLITPHIVKKLIFVRQFVHDNNCTIQFDSFGFSVKDFLTCRVLLRCDSTGDLYSVTAPSPILHAFLVSQHTWHQRLGHPGSEVLWRLVSSNFISCNKEKLPVLCHACQLGKHVRLPFVSSSSVVSACFDIIHSDVWTSPILSLSGFKYYVLFLDHYSQFV
ncbi:ribonuclease H-like domain-containing protein [Tanacetum coccineum]|uniref:Ribonuclease H-like domain-containing protein n=1 Tax=Tanacetum coccineum TaxID=301880 RepID=A0ABQ5BRS0_9ASTR